MGLIRDLPNRKNDDILHDISPPGRKKMKKNAKFLVSDWKFLLIACIVLDRFMFGGVCLYGQNGGVDDPEMSGIVVRVKPVDAKRQPGAGDLGRQLDEAKLASEKLAAENRALRGAAERNRRELIELTNMYQMQNGRYRRLQLVLSGALAGEKVRSAGEREEQLLKALADTAMNGGSLAMKTVQFCERMENELRELPVGKVRRAELQLMLEDMKRDSRRFIGQTAPREDGNRLEKCRILAVNRELSIVILPVGAVHGAFYGLKYRVGKDQAELRVVGVRPFVAAARVISGRIEDLSPGMEAAATKQQAAEKFRQK